MQIKLYFRYFETGIYEGFFRANWKDLFSDVLSEFNISKCFIISIYNNWDILAVQKRRLEFQKGKFC